MDSTLQKRFLVLFLFLAGLTGFSQISYEPAFPNLRFEFPVEIQNANDGSNRMFVVEQRGRIRVFPNNPGVGSGQVQTFLDIRSRVSFSNGQEVGLLGLAFHPNFRTNRYIYVYFTDRPGNYRINVARFQVSATNPNFVDPGTELLIASFIKNQPESNHNGGKIAFGPDGYLYISVGDGGGAGDPRRNAQNLQNAFGSILRIDVDLDGNNPVESNPESPNGNYEIPSDNPRLGTSGLDELYAWGIRNTWKFSFDPATNRLWGGDVGQGDREEINLIERGRNYGWNRFEGTTLESSSTALATSPDTKPVYEYNHNSGDVSITAGYVYRGSIADPLIQGRLVFGDYVSGRVWSLAYNPSTGTASSTLLFRTNGQFVSSFGLDEQGEIFFSDYGTSAQLYRIRGENTGPVTQPVNGVGTWASPGNGTNGVIQAIARDADGVYYLGGQFSSAGGIATSNLAVYGPGGWGTIGGTNGQVFAIAAAPDGRVYVGGDFSQIGGVPANNIAFWDGSAWNPMGSGTNGQVQAIAVAANNRVYAGGSFESAGGAPASNIAYWENNSWSVLRNSGTGIEGTNNEIRAIAIDEAQNIYVGGNFDTAGGVTAPRIAFWNRTSWSSLGSGTSGFVQAIEVTPSHIYAGGNFALAGGQTVNRIARWVRNQNRWEPLNLGLSGNVNALAHDGTYLYVGGSFETASNQANINLIMNNAARWNTSGGWQALGPGRDVGTDNSVNAMAFNEGRTQLWAAGAFGRAGAENVSNVAIWSTGAICTSESIIPEYQVNGVWSQGENRLTVNEGDRVVLSILPNNISFTVERPNGSSTSGDLDLGAVTLSDAGIYVFTTQAGCRENFELEVIESNIEDADGDGVADDLDACPDTPAGAAVDASGCAASQRDTDDDGVNDDVDSCPGTPAGAVVDSSGCAASQRDTDNDGVTDNRDSCPNTPPGATVDSSGCAASQRDTDNDGVTDDRDNCPNTPQGATVDSSGCAASQRDTDNDGINDDRDSCPNTPPGATVDSRGCAASQRDSDNDGVNDDRDTCPNTPAGAAVNSNGCAASQLDTDNDGVTDDRDRCPNTPAGATTDADGCADSQKDTDGDGVTDDRDICPNTPAGEPADFNGCSDSQKDGDGDGVTDDSDQCPNTPSGAAVDTTGCSGSSQDSDQDGVIDEIDLCPGTPPGIAVDAFGCSELQRDSDRDGVADVNDLCPNTPIGAAVDSDGCAASQRDSDNDGVNDNRDSCPNTPAGAAVDGNGCAASQRDSDNDGVNDDRDACPGTPPGATVNTSGCAASQRDSDNDGVSDDRDACPNTPAGAAVDGNGCAASQRDSDNDGVRDDRDACPGTPPGATVNASGCAASQRDSDNDGVADDIDTCPNTPSGETADSAGCSASQRDSDNDGVADSLDSCPNTPAGAAVDASGCSATQRDSDGDGVNDDRDACPDTPANTEVDATGCPLDTDSDTDGDGVPDSGDVCPNTPSGSTVDQNGCPVDPNIQQFAILGRGLSCRGTDDGIFEITAVTEGTYQVAVAGIDVSYTESQTFSGSIAITDLAPGSYELCISGTGVTDPQCFVGVITQPDPLEVVVTLNASRTSVDLRLKGGSSYTIYVNGFSFKTTSSEVTLALDREVTELVVETDKSCQGIFETVIETDLDASVSPNPFSQRFVLDIPGRPDQQYALTAYSASGQLVHASSAGGGRTEIEMASIPSGIYYLVIQGEEFEQVIKIVKK